MILTEQPGLLSSSTRRDNWGRSDDVRRSIDVLDKVLSEFDDISGFCSSENSSQGSYPSDSEHQKVNSSPPPVDRSLKPRISPPTLPKKMNRKSQESLPELPDDIETLSNKKPVVSPTLASPTSTTNTHQSQKSRRSEASSHEYQEINCVPINTREVMSTKSIAAQHLHMPPPEQLNSSRSHSRNRLVRGNSALEPRHIGRLESPMRKSKSGDVSLTSEDVQRRHGRRNNARRARSTDRVIDPRLDPFFNPHIQDHRFKDPRLFEPRFVDRRIYDPRFMDPRMIDPRFFDHKLVDPLLLDPNLIDPRFLDPCLNDPRLIDPRFIEPPFIMDDARLARFPMEDPMQFPHLMTLPAGVPGPYSMPPIDPNDYPHTIPRYNDFQSMQDPLLNPDMIPPLPPLDPHLVQGFHPHFKDIDPLMNDPNMLAMLPPPNFPGYPLDLPISYPLDNMFPINYPSREKLNFEGDRGVPMSRGSQQMMDPRSRTRKKDWMPPTSEEAKRSIQRVVRSCSKEDEDRDFRGEINGNQRTNRLPQQSQNRRLTSTGHSDSSGRSSPLDEFSQNSRARGSRGFRVGDPVRKDSDKSKALDTKDSVSLPHFTTGGKDSGFEEAPVAEDRNSIGRNQTPGFVVAGVFSDASKMYIPAPPSPTPDYDRREEDTDEGESDILQESFYVKSPKDAKEKLSKTSSSSTRDSLSDDSLQGVTKKKTSSGTNSLQALMKEFHQGLPPLRPYEGTYSDDSLEEDPAVLSQSKPNLVDLRSSRRPQSMESLVSMDGSTTSFDYVGDLHAKFPSTSRLNSHIHKDKSRSSLDEKRTQLKATKKNIINNNKSDQIKNKQPLRKSESLPWKPRFANKENIKRKGSKSSTSSSNEENDILNNQNKTSNESKKFNTIRNLIKEGLIEGLNETPPDFKPPPSVPKLGRSSSNLEDRADSGLGSSVSTNNRLDESGASDNISDKSSPSKNSSSERLQRNSPPPPLPPPRESSMPVAPLLHAPNQPLQRNQSWMYRNKRQAPPAPPVKDVASNRNVMLPLRTSVSSKELSSNKKKTSSKSKKMMEKITHVDYINPSASIANGNLASQYATPLDQKREILDNSQYMENHKNDSSYRSYNDNLSMIYEDRASLSSQGSRSSRFFSRITESMKSNRSSSNSSTKNKKNSASKFYHGDVIRDPTLNHDVIRDPTLNHKGSLVKPILTPNHKGSLVKPILTPPEFQRMICSEIPLNRDGSGRFRSIEDLAAIAERRKGLNPRGGDHDDLDKKRKKNSTLPPNLTPADMERHVKEFSKKGSRAIVGNRDESDGSKFKFNIFKGFWRRNKYSFDKY